MVLLAFAALGWIAQRPLFAVQRVVVQGHQGAPLRHVNAPTVRANLAGKVSGSFFTVNLDDVRQAFEAVPWVRHASVRRLWPNGLVVDLEEHRPLGIWGSPESGRLVNQQGELFVANLAEAEDDVELIALHGPDGTSADVTAELRAIEPWLAPLQARIVEITLDQHYGWAVRLKSGMRLELGRDQGEQQRAAMRERIQRFLLALPQATQRFGANVESVDLRYPNGFALRTSQGGRADGHHD